MSKCKVIFDLQHSHDEKQKEAEKKVFDIDECCWQKSQEWMS